MTTAGDAAPGVTNNQQSGDTLSPLTPLASMKTFAPTKRLGVSAEPTMFQSAVPVEIKYYDKDAK